jgi:hypothetical protein
MSPDQQGADIETCPPLFGLKHQFAGLVYSIPSIQSSLMLAGPV